MRSLIIFLVAICLAKFACAQNDEIENTDVEHESSGGNESDVEPVEKEPKIVNKITPREYIARRVIVELGKAGYTVSSQKVSF